MTEPSSSVIKFDQTVSREQATKLITKEPEGAPFWKYHVKDSVVSVPARSFKFSENPAQGHPTKIEKAKEPDQLKDYCCGRISKKLEDLTAKYETLHEIDQKERFNQLDKSGTLGATEYGGPLNMAAAENNLAPVSEIQSELDLASNFDR